MLSRYKEEKSVKTVKSGSKKSETAKTKVNKQYYSRAIMRADYTNIQFKNINYGMIESGRLVSATFDDSKYIDIGWAELIGLLLGVIHERYKDNFIEVITSAKLLRDGASLSKINTANIIDVEDERTGVYRVIDGEYVLTLLEEASIIYQMIYSSIKLLNLDVREVRFAIKRCIKQVSVRDKIESDEYIEKHKINSVYAELDKKYFGGFSESDFWHEEEYIKQLNKEKARSKKEYVCGIEGIQSWYFRTREVKLIYKNYNVNKLENKVLDIVKFSLLYIATYDLAAFISLSRLKMNEWAQIGLNADSEKYPGYERYQLKSTGLSLYYKNNRIGLERFLLSNIDNEVIGALEFRLSNEGE